MAGEFDLESLVHVEQNFYDEGYQGGFAHGRIHGLIEGRALGREQGFEMWEELGFYEGFALAWRAILVKQGRADDRPSQHIRHLLDAISQFPRVNPKPVADSEQEVDIPKLFRQIRSRYKVLCSSLGVRPRLRSSEAASGLLDGDDGEDADMDDLTTQTRTQSKLGGKLRGGSSIPVWKIDNAGFKKPVTNEDLSY